MATKDCSTYQYIDVSDKKKRMNFKNQASPVSIWLKHTPCFYPEGRPGAVLIRDNVETIIRLKPRAATLLLSTDTADNPGTLKGDSEASHKCTNPVTPCRRIRELTLNNEMRPPCVPLCATRTDTQFWNVKTRDCIVATSKSNRLWELHTELPGHGCRLIIGILERF